MFRVTDKPIYFENTIHFWICHGIEVTGQDLGNCSFVRNLLAAVNQPYTTSPRTPTNQLLPFSALSTTPTISWSAGKSQDGRRRLKVRSSPQYEVVSEIESEGAYGGVLFLFSFSYFTLFYVYPTISFRSAHVSDFFKIVESSVTPG